MHLYYSPTSPYVRKVAVQDDPGAQVIAALMQDLPQGDV